jgi:hypothetical protein
LASPQRHWTDGPGGSQASRHRNIRDLSLLVLGSKRMGSHAAAGWPRPMVLIWLRSVCLVMNKCCCMNSCSLLYDGVHAGESEGDCKMRSRLMLGLFITANFFSTT